MSVEENDKPPQRGVRRLQKSGKIIQIFWLLGFLSYKYATTRSSSSLFRAFGECLAALPTMGDTIVGACPTVPGGLWIADVSRCAP